MKCCEKLKARPLVALLVSNKMNQFFDNYQAKWLPYEKIPRWGIFSQDTFEKHQAKFGRIKKHPLGAF
jgi:hypothetical protein